MLRSVACVSMHVDDLCLPNILHARFLQCAGYVLYRALVSAVIG